MTDIVGKDTRSRMMSGIKGKDTKPELIVRKALHALGFRFRLHDQRLPGKPDIYFPKFEAVIFVNGCFWHRHHCSYFKWPSTRPDFWKEKLENNAVRDEKKRADLAGSGIRSLVVWECVLRNVTEQELQAVINEISEWLVKFQGSAEIPAPSI